MLGSMTSSGNWQDVLKQRLRRFGHRNWVVVADAAYPSQSAPGIETVAADADHVVVATTVLEAIAESGHVRAIVHVDAELSYVSESDAPGVDRYHKSIERVLASREVQRLPHEDLIRQLDEAAKRFHVLIIKTPLTIPYTSVFVRLDCGYWTTDAERRLRASMRDKEQNNANV